MKTIEQGQIWEVVTDNFHTSKQKETFDRELLLSKGEKIEIRYPYAWHFRTEDNKYFHAEPDVILQNCKLIGVIWEKIRWNNQANLDEILRLKLYDAIKCELE